MRAPAVVFRAAVRVLPRISALSSTVLRSAPAFDLPAKAGSHKIAKQYRVASAFRRSAPAFDLPAKAGSHKIAKPQNRKTVSRGFRLQAEGCRRARQ
jgi:hypothetical protein